MGVGQCSQVRQARDAVRALSSMPVDISPSGGLPDDGVEAESGLVEVTVDLNIRLHSYVMSGAHARLRTLINNVNFMCVRSLASVSNSSEAVGIVVRRILIDDRLPGHRTYFMDAFGRAARMTKINRDHEKDMHSLVNRHYGRKVGQEGREWRGDNTDVEAYANAVDAMRNVSSGLIR